MYSQVGKAPKDRLCRRVSALLQFKFCKNIFLFFYRHSLRCLLTSLCPFVSWNLWAFMCVCVIWFPPPPPGRGYERQSHDDIPGLVRPAAADPHRGDWTVGSQPEPFFLLMRHRKWERRRTHAQRRCMVLDGMVPCRRRPRHRRMYIHLWGI